MMSPEFVISYSYDEAALKNVLIFSAVHDISRTFDFVTP